MTLSELVRAAHRSGASDLHLEPGLPPAFRVHGRLDVQRGPLSRDATRAMAQELAGNAGWQEFLATRSLDLARTVAGVRCRINVLQSRKGVGLAVRLLPASSPSLDGLNLHPSLADLADQPHGLVLVSGPTGSGKSSTVAALLEHINATRPRHILTLEQPVEFALRSRRSFIRQREVGRDTPSFEQGLLDALREDPDVIAVGEMRRPETMRLTLGAAETGHLVFATVHSATVTEALHRVIASFPSEAQPSVQAQLADALCAVVNQRLVGRDGLAFRVPELAILRANEAARAAIRSGNLKAIPTILETGGADGSWTRERYGRWMNSQSFLAPAAAPSLQAADEPDDDALPPLSAPARSSRRRAPAPRTTDATEDGVYVLDDDGTDAVSILSELLDDPKA